MIALPTDRSLSVEKHGQPGHAFSRNCTGDRHSTKADVGIGVGITVEVEVDGDCDFVSCSNAKLSLVRQQSRWRTRFFHSCTYRFGGPSVRLLSAVRPDSKPTTIGAACLAVKFAQ